MGKYNLKILVAAKNLSLGTKERHGGSVSNAAQDKKRTCQLRRNMIIYTVRWYSAQRVTNNPQKRA